MLFDQTPHEPALSEDEQKKRQRLREEEEARERWNRDLEEGKRQRRERQALSRRLREKALETTPAGRARVALESGATVFQLVLPLPAPVHSAGVANANSSPDQEGATDHNAILNAIESQGWRLEHASYVDRRSAASSRDVPAPSGEGERAGDQTVAIYIFRRSA